MLVSKLMWQPVDFVTAWKAISIALTGAFGILGLLTEFKDKDTKKITKWGYVSLVGILVSSCLGIVAQLKESNDSAKKALAAAQTSNDMLHQIKRLVTPIGIPKVAMLFEISCDNHEFIFNDFCRDLLRTQASMPMTDVLTHLMTPDQLWMARLNHRPPSLVTSPLTWRHWPYKNDMFMEVDLNFFRNRSDADRFWSNGFEGPKPDLEIQTSVVLKDQSTHKLTLEVYPSLTKATIRLPPVEDLASTGKLTSFEDFDGATLVMTTPLWYLFSVATPKAILITNPEGKSIEIAGPFEKKSTDRRVLTEKPWGYRYRFPNVVDASQSNELSTVSSSNASQPPAK